MSESFVDLAMEEANNGDDEEKFEVTESQNVLVQETGEAVENINEIHRPSFCIKDHYSVNIPSSSLRLRSSRGSSSSVRVYEHRNKQMLLEITTRDNKNQVTVKNVANTTLGGVYALRATYTLVAFLMSGFLFLLCFQIIMYLFLDLAVATGYTEQGEANGWVFVGTLLSLPLFIYGLATAMVLAFSFAFEAWGGGHAYIKPSLQMNKYSPVVSEWAFFLIFLGIPVTVIGITLVARLDNWWEISALTWFFMVFSFYLVFCGTVFYYEISSYIEVARDLVQEEEENSSHGSDSNNMWPFVSLLRRIILTRQMSALSGVRKSMYLVDVIVRKDEKVDDELLDALDSANDDPDFSHYKVVFRDTIRFYTRFTQLCAKCCGAYCFTNLDPPTRIYTIEEVLGTKSYVTYQSWSLDKIYCSNRQRSVMVLSGPSALHSDQIKSSFACAILGNALALFLCIGILVWFSLPAAVIIILAILISLCMFPGVRTSVLMYRLYRDVNKAQKGEGDSDNEPMEEEGGASNRSGNHDSNGNEGIQQIWKIFRVTRASDGLCWFTFWVVGMGLFFIWPLIQLFVNGNYPLAVVFLITAIFSGIQIYLNPAVVLRELGSLDDGKDDKTRSNSDDKEWKKRSRLFQILASINQRRSQNVWIIVLAFFVLVFLVMCILSIQDEDDSGAIPEDAVLLPDFKYDARPNLPYPTCKLKKGLGIPEDEKAALIDYVFLSNVAYLDPSVTQGFLDGWFGAGNARDEQDRVDEFKTLSDTRDSSVSYKFITFPNVTDGFGVVSIRGTVKTIDMFVDAKLWSAAAITQIVRSILPLGKIIWTPILNTLIRVVSIIGKETVSEVAYYKHTTNFVKSLQNSGEFATVHLTGQSLGGGLAIISGAQTGAPTVALSGPNAMLSRDTFDPRLKISELNRLVFNIVPDRDPIPRVDDFANLYQRIECRAPQNAIFGCHAALRSLCEVIYTCGTENRPAICQCKELGYPEPIPTGSRSFAQACSSL